MRGQGHWSELLPEEQLSRDEAQRVLKRLWAMLRGYYGGIAVASVLLVVQVGALLSGPPLMGDGIDALKSHDRARLDRDAGLFLALAFVGLILGRLVTMLIARLGESFLQQLRRRLFRHLMGLSMGFFETEQTGRLVARMTSDIDALQELLSQGLALMVQNVLLFSGTLVFIFVIVGPVPRA